VRLGDVSVLIDGAPEDPRLTGLAGHAENAETITCRLQPEIMAVDWTGDAELGYVIREHAIRLLVVVCSDSQLLEIVTAIHPRGGFAHFLDGGQEQSDQYRNDGNNDE
jgi:hypothetical protein